MQHRIIGEKFCESNPGFLQGSTVKKIWDLNGMIGVEILEKLSNNKFKIDSGLI